MKPVRRGLRSCLVAVGALMLLAGPAGADISIDFDDFIKGPPGSLTKVAEVEVPAEFVGNTCVLAVIAENQASVHPGNDLIVSTGDSEAVILGVEDEVNGGTSQEYAMVVGSTIVVRLRFGPHGISSLGFTLAFDCTRTVATEVPDLDTQRAEQQVTTTTTTPPPTSSTLPPPPAPIPETTTTTAPPAVAESCSDGSTAGDTTAGSAVVTTETCGEEPATVAGATTNDLPLSEPAAPVVAAPAYTG